MERFILFEIKVEKQDVFEMYVCSKIVITINLVFLQLNFSNLTLP